MKERRRPVEPARRPMRLELRGLAKNYGKKQAVRPLTTALGPGIYGLLGPNGAGKTTLMTMITGLTRPTAGEVLCDGEPIWRLGAAYRSRLGYLPQHVGMYRNFTGRDMLLYFAALKGVASRAEAKREADALLEKVNLAADAKRRVGQYSGGMRQRLGIAQALIGSPDLLIFDEPTAGLDPKERIRFKGLLSELSETTIILLATHIVSDVENLAHRVLLLREGELLGNRTVPEFLEEMAGKVWTLEIPAAQAEPMAARFPVSRMDYRDGMAALRVSADTPPAEGALPAEPTLDDLYIAYFGETGGGADDPV